MMRVLKKCIPILFLFFTYSSNAQNSKNYLQVATGFNRIGLFNEAAFKFDVKNHQFKFGLRHYTLDNFFEKNTVGFSFDYSYQILSEKNKFYFYPGLSSSFFMENKTNAQVFISDYKLINGIGINLNSKWSIFYQLGFGLILTKSYQITSIEVIKQLYFNYEFALGVNYRFVNKKKQHLK